MGILDFFRKSRKVEEEENIKYLDVNILKNSLSEVLNDDAVVESIVNRVIDLSQKREKSSIEKRYISESELISIVEEYANNISQYTFRNRIDLCKEVDDIISQSPELFNAVRLYASYIVFGASSIKIDQYKYILVSRKGSDDYVEIEKDLEKARNILDEFENKSEIKKIIYEIAKDLIKYGDAFLEIIRDNNKKIINVAYIPSNRVLIFTDEFGRVKKIAQVLKDISILNEMDIFSKKENKDIVLFEKGEFLHFDDRTPAGISDNPFLNIAKLWRLIKILEQSLVVYKVGRAKRLISFFVDVSNKTEEEVRKYIEAFKRKLQAVFSIDTKSGDIYSNNVNLSIGQDLIIPIRGNSKTRIEAIQADTSQRYSEEILPFYQRLLNNLFVNWAIGIQRTGKEDLEKEAFLRLVKIYQSSIAEKLTKLYQKILEQNNINTVKVLIEFPSPETEMDVKIVDAILRRIMVINQVISIIGTPIPIEWIIKYAFKDLSYYEIDELI
ncbi:MAG: portal protein, partial [Nanopusillaceae archaeon]